MKGTWEVLSKKAKLIVAAGIALLLILILFNLRGGKEETQTAQASPAVKVDIVTVSPTSIPEEVSASGTVRAIIESKIAPKIMSNVSAVYVHEGDHVRKGQLLIKLEARDLQAQVSQSRAAISAASAGASKATAAIDLQRAQTSTNIASAKSALEAARQQLSIVKEGARKQQKIQAQLAVIQAEAQFKNTEVELGRMKRLFEQDVIPKQRLDAAQTSYDVMKAQYDSAKQQASLVEEGSRKQEIRAAEEQVRQAEEALRMAKASVVQNKMTRSEAVVARSQVTQASAGLQYAQVQLDYAYIKSPISGVVTQRLVDPGDTVSPGTPVIEIEDDSLYRLEVTLPQSNVDAVYVGKAVNVVIGGSTITRTGKVAVVSPAGDPASRKFLVKINLPKEAGARSGDFGRAQFPIRFTQGFIVPENAVHDEGGLSTVYLIGPGDKAKLQAVKLGRKIDGGIEILSGIRTGDHVILNSSGELSDGVAVQY